MMRTLFSLFVMFGLAVSAAAQDTPPRPNIVLILADDLGQGDLGCYNGESVIPTPNIDRLAAQGMRFVDAHSPSAVCTPTRYGLMTGRYGWRTRLQAWTLNGYSPLLIERGRQTLASRLARTGYSTSVVGKWHLGMGAFDPEHPDAETDFSRALRAGPHTVGFQEVYCIPASLDMPPYGWVEGAMMRLPLTREVERSEPVRQGGEGFWRAGAASPGFRFDSVLGGTMGRSLVQTRMLARTTPFFLYVAFTAPHTPWVPEEQFKGKTTIGPYGDFVAQVDWSVGKIVEELVRINEAENTIVIFASDNGAHWTEGDIEKTGHHANLSWRGQKADIHEGGHRVPMVVRWPGVVEPGSRSTALVGLQDVYATIAEALELELPKGEAPDSVSFVPALRGQDGDRETMVHHSGNGMFAIRHGKWKLIEGLGSGGFSRPQRREPEDGEVPGQLYDLESDRNETTNVYADHPDVVAELTAVLAEIRAAEDGGGE